jgi:hypothetical protein
MRRRWSRSPSARVGIAGGIKAPVNRCAVEETRAERPIAGKLDDAPPRFRPPSQRAVMICPEYTIGHMRMNVEPTNGLLDRHLWELRETFADTMIIIDVIRDLGPRPEAARLLPQLYIQLATVQQVVRRARRVLTRYVPLEGRHAT